MTKLLRYGGQVAAYALFALFVGYFSNSPAYTFLSPEKAMIKVSFSHSSERIHLCTRLSAQEIAKRAKTNMRKTVSCPRGRVPVAVEIIVDGAVLYDDEVQPSGLFADGPASTYRRFAIEPGTRRVRASMRDSRLEAGFDHVYEETVELVAGRVLLIEFDSGLKRFTFD